MNNYFYFDTLSAAQVIYQQNPIHNESNIFSLRHISSNKRREFPLGMSIEENKSMKNTDLKLNFMKTEGNAQCRD